MTVYVTVLSDYHKGREIVEWIVERKNCIEVAEDMVQYLAFGMKVLERYD
jgi:hypothetical protein